MKYINMMREHDIQFVSSNMISKRMGDWQTYVKPSFHLDIQTTNNVIRAVMPKMYEWKYER